MLGLGLLLYLSGSPSAPLAVKVSRPAVSIAAGACSEPAGHFPPLRAVGIAAGSDMSPFVPDGVHGIWVADGELDAVLAGEKGAVGQSSVSLK